MSLFSRSPVRIQPFFGYRNTERLLIGARALRSDPVAFERMSQWRALRTMWGQFASAEAAGVRVSLTVRRPDGVERRYGATSDREGYAWFDIALDGDWARPARTGWEVVELGWENAKGPQSVEGHVMVPGQDIRLAVISDIDDTIIETGITGGLRNVVRNWRRMLIQLPHDRKQVAGAGGFYGELGGGRQPGQEGAAIGSRLTVSRRPFFYVSSSPWNLFPYLVAFLRGRELPLGPMMLRDWSFDRATLGSAGHAAHKSRSIAKILDLYPDLRFALIGDDTQGDLAAFAQTVERAPGRIAAVFIRCLGQPLSAEEIEAKTTIEGAGVPLWLGSDYDTGNAFLRTAGLAVDDETANIVKMIEEGSYEQGSRQET
ncbi:DUF2183 domain-containing protein [Erythrobacter sp. LQ02-29]|uniref:phosphatase domain-containing protein n=1 Tax=Erythrobacter sp. LQ02-29 TaxID=2920384 RepID=UPI001F4EA7CC|nr:phosphatase domain-containing protein [Erythrobacter sp. LQ02-29]MCP9221908.1 DUF2183 domain-containing protein [Erythrobacter sp. LQ02-29]